MVLHREVALLRERLGQREVLSPGGAGVRNPAGLPSDRLWKRGLLRRPLEGKEGESVTHRGTMICEDKGAGWKKT